MRSGTGVMMSKIQCFFLEPTDRAEHSFRRYRESTKYLKNPDGSYVTTPKKDSKGQDYDAWIIDTSYNGRCPKGSCTCDAVVVVGECAADDSSRIPSDELKLDPRWPKACECGYVFQPEDRWQDSNHRFYRRTDTGELHLLSSAPVGAMWDAVWYKDIKTYKVRQDGIMLVVRTPGGDWCVDGPSNNGNGWERTGTVPKVTANPSISMPDYHGWLRDGYLVKC